MLTTPGSRQLNARLMPGNAPRDPAQLAQAQIENFRRLIDDFQAKRDAIKLRLADPSTPEDKKQELRDSMAALDSQIGMLNEQIRQQQRQFFPSRRRRN
jgi:hypothetical protein